MEKQKKYYVFISYNNEDEKWAKKLQRKLEHFHLPASFNGRTDVRDNLLEVFRDRDELHAGPDWEKQVITALENTHNLIVICSPRAAKSEAVNKEIERFIALGNEDNIFPFIIEGDKPEVCFPPALKHTKIGGDVNKEGKDAAFIKVVAGMLGVDFETLWQRHKREQRKNIFRRFVIISLLISAMSIMGWNLLKNEVDKVAHESQQLIDNGDSYAARKKLLSVRHLPKTLNYERTFRNAVYQDNTIIYGHSGYLAFNPVKKELALADMNSTHITLWDIEHGTQRMELNLLGLTDDIDRVSNITAIAYSPDGDRLVTGHFSGKIAIRDPRTCRLIGNPFGDGLSNVIQITFTKNGKHIIVKDCYGKIEEWNVSQRKRIDRVASSISNDVLSLQNGKFLVGGQLKVLLNKEKLNVFDNKTNICLDSIFIPNGYGDAVISSDGAKIALSYNQEKIVRIIDLSVYQNAVNMQQTKFFSEGRIGNKFFYHTNDSTLNYVDIENSDNVFTFPCPKDNSFRYALSLDNEKMASVYCDSTIIVWNVSTGKVEMQIQDSCKIKNLLFSHDAKYVISLSNKIRVWDLKTKKCVRNIDWDLPCKGVAHSPTEYRLAIYYGILTYWIGTCDYLEENTDIVKLGRKDVWHTNDVNGIVFSPNGKFLLSVSDDKTLKIWDPKSNKCIQTIHHSSSVKNASFSEDGKQIVSLTGDNVIYLWDTKNGESIWRVSIYSRMDYVFFSRLANQIIVLSKKGYLGKYT